MWMYLYYKYHINDAYTNIKLIRVKLIFCGKLARTYGGHPAGVACPGSADLRRIVDTRSVQSQAPGPLTAAIHAIRRGSCPFRALPARTQYRRSSPAGEENTSRRL